MQFVDWALRFFLYSLTGWIIESVYATILAHRWVNRGFLNGPYCPIYGCGALIILLALNPLRHNWWLLLIAAIVLTTVLEYITGYVMEKAFKTRWWDYTKYILNLHGRICLQTSLLWGGMCLLLVYLVEPQVGKFLALFTYEIRLAALVIFIIALAADLMITVRHALNLNEQLARLQRLLQRARSFYREDNLRRRMGNIRHGLNEWRCQVKNIGAVQRRLLQAFPHIRSVNYPEAMQKLRDWLKRTGRISNGAVAGKRRLRSLFRKPDHSDTKED